MVGDAPASWLTAPQAAAAPVRAPVAETVARPLRAPLRDVAPRPSPAADAAARLAAAADSLAALDAAIASLDHPLRDTALAPRLLTGNAASGVLVLTDVPEADDSEAAALRDRMLAAIGLDQASAAILHLLPWPTPGGRAPRSDETMAFAPFVTRAIALVAPRAVLAFGAHAAALASDGGGIASLRGRWLSLNGVPFLATYHPRTLLTQQAWKKAAWADLQAFQARLAEPA